MWNGGRREGISFQSKTSVNLYQTGGFLELSADDVVYFDPFLDRRLDGLAALTGYYESLRGKVGFTRSEMLHPRVHAGGDMAVLTFNFVAWGGNEKEYRWNCTEVLRRRPDGNWEIIQAHWSLTHADRSN